MPGSDSDSTAPPAGPPPSAADRRSGAHRPDAHPAGAQPPAVRKPGPEPVLLPDVTADERDIGWGELPEPMDDDRYLREVPPHHGS